MPECGPQSDEQRYPHDLVLPAARQSDIGPHTRETRQLSVEREFRVTRTETARVRLEGLLLVCELADALFIIPAAELTGDTNAAQFREELLRLAKTKPYLVIDLNQQGSLPTDAIVWPLIDLHQACGEQSKLIVATRDPETRERFTLMTRDRMWRTVESGRAALDLIDLENFLAQRRVARGE